MDQCYMNYALAVNLRKEAFKEWHYHQQKALENWKHFRKNGKIHYKDFSVKLRKFSGK